MTIIFPVEAFQLHLWCFESKTWSAKFASFRLPRASGTASETTVDIIYLCLYLIQETSLSAFLCGTADCQSAMLQGQSQKLHSDSQSKGSESHAVCLQRQEESEKRFQTAVDPADQCRSQRARGDILLRRPTLHLVLILKCPYIWLSSVYCGLLAAEWCPNNASEAST